VQVTQAADGRHGVFEKLYQLAVDSVRIATHAGDVPSRMADALNQPKRSEFAVWQDGYDRDRPRRCCNGDQVGV